MKIGDRVLITFSDGRQQEGQIKDILRNDSFNYIVTTKVYGKDCDVYYNPESLKVI